MELTVHGPAGALKSALSLIGRVKMCLYITENIEAPLHIRGHISYRALRAVRGGGGCGKGALMGALRFVGV